ncbi:MAG: MATE family efflux transporter [Kiritimatiellia bacterium]
MFSSRKGNIRDAFRTSLPLVLAMGAHAVNQFTDRVFLARYSDAAIQASLPGGILSWLFICLLVATAGYSGTFVAQFHGAGSRRDAASAYGQGLWLALASLPLILLSIPLGHWLFDISGHAPEILADEKPYYSILQLGGVFCVLEAVLAGFFTGQGRTRLVGFSTILGNLSNVLLDWMFIFGHGGCGRWGIVGAGWATVIALAVPCAVLGAVTLFDPALRGRRYLVALRPRPDLLRRIIRFGLPSGLHQFLDVATFTVFVMVTGRLDDLSLAVSNIVFAVNTFSFAPLLGLGQGTTVLVGQYQGANDPTASMRATASALLLGAAYALIFALVVACFSDAIMDLFRNPETKFDAASYHALGRTLMWIMLSWAIFDAISLIVGGALKGAGDTKFVMFALLAISLGLWMPAVFAVLHFAPSITLLWITMPVYCAVCAATCIVRFLLGGWKKLRLVDDLVTH